MRKLLKSKKALSPVVAAIILIAVTVAVSIAVAAWMGSLTIGFMETKELTVTQMVFDYDGVDPADGIAVELTNSGTSDVTVALVKINGVTQTGNWVITVDAAEVSTIESGQDGTLAITMDVTAGNKYAVSLFTSDGTMVGSYSDTA